MSDWVAKYRANNVPVDAAEEKALIWLDTFTYGHKWLVYMEVVRKCKTQTMPAHARNFQRWSEQIKMNPDEQIAAQKSGTDLKDLLLMEAPRIKKYVKAKGHRWILSDEPIGDNTLHSIQISVSSFFHTCGADLGKKFPFAEPQQNVPVPTLAEIVEMDKACDNARDRAIIWLVEATGLRPSSLLDLTWQDFQDATQIAGASSHFRISSCLILAPSRGKGKAQGGYKNSNTITFVHDYAWKIIQEYKATIDPKPTDPIFKTNEGNVRFLTYNEIDCAAFHKIFERIRRRAFGKAKDKQFSPNGFRHFYHDCLTNAHVDPINKLLLGSHTIRDASNPYVGSHPKITDERVKNIRDDYAKALQYLRPRTQEEKLSDIDDQIKALEKQKKTV